MGKSEVYGIDTAASWYHATWCHSFDHHEWIHAELERAKGREEGAYEAADVAHQLYVSAMNLMREVYDTAQMPGPLRAKMKTFMDGADWHEAVRRMVEGDE